jgi:hypothetical protein
MNSDTMSIRPDPFRNQDNLDKKYLLLIMGDQGEVRRVTSTARIVDSPIDRKARLIKKYICKSPGLEMDRKYNVKPPGHRWRGCYSGVRISGS